MKMPSTNKKKNGNNNTSNVIPPLSKNDNGKESGRGGDVGNAVPKMGPDPVLLSRKEIDALYEIFEAVVDALKQLQVDYIVTGGSLLGAIRQHSILFCDDDIDIAILEHNNIDIDCDYVDCDNDGHNNNDNDGSIGDGHDPTPSSPTYKLVSSNLQNLIGDRFLYQIKPWEGGDRVRSRRMNNVFLDLFVIRKYESKDHLVKEVIGKKKNGKPQPVHYVENILKAIQESASTEQHYTPSQKMESGITTKILPSNPSILDRPFYHFTTRKAVEMWPKEVYRPNELFPLRRDLKLGPVVNVQGPKMPVLLLKRAFGNDCFEVYYQSESHQQKKKTKMRRQKQTPTIEHHAITVEITAIDHKFDRNTFIENEEINSQNNINNMTGSDASYLPPIVAPGGAWEGGKKVPLEDNHYLPMQPTLRALRRPTLHNKKNLFLFLEMQTKLEKGWIAASKSNNIVEGEGKWTWKVEEKKGQAQEQLLSLTKNANSGAIVENEKDPFNTKRDSKTRPSQTTVYMDGVFDLFHVGHLRAIQQCVELGTRRVIIGVTGDADAAGYKRFPVIPQEERADIVRCIKGVDCVICPCPLLVTIEFMEEHGIDLVVHGFANDTDAHLQEKDFFYQAIQAEKFQRIGYYSDRNTTGIIEKIQNRTLEQQQQIQTSLNPSSTCDVSNSTSTSISNTTALQRCKKDCEDEGSGGTKSSKKKLPWFGALISQHTLSSVDIPTDPFPLSLRHIIEPHIRQAAKCRKEALDAIKRASGAVVYNRVLAQFKECGIAQEYEFYSTSSNIGNAAADKEVHEKNKNDVQYNHYDIDYPLKLKHALLDALGLPSEYDLGNLHKDEDPTVNKDALLYNLTKNFIALQDVYDTFVREVCVPRMSSLLDCETEMYYQAFPCIRIVQPNEFSIGPHSDVMYGHHPCTLNFCLPLTETEGTASSLFLETRPGSEDWHPIFEPNKNKTKLGTVKHFAGAICTHWTTENKTDKTRVSFDFRLIAGSMYGALKCGGSEPGGKRDVYREKGGYYNCCRLVRRPKNLIRERTKMATTATENLLDIQHDDHEDENNYRNNDSHNLPISSFIWKRVDDSHNGKLLSPPDARFGFPFTVKNWNKILRR